MTDVEELIVEATCSALGCEKDDVGVPVALDAGLNNRSYLVEVGSERYVFRVPGIGTELFVDRVAEKQALEAARGIGLDKTYVCMDEATGWKISRYLDGAVKLDCRNRSQVEAAMALLRKLHTSGKRISHVFDFVEDFDYLEGLLQDGGVLSGTARQLSAAAHEFGVFLKRHEEKSVFCHNDFYRENILIAASGEMQLIDWEYAAMGQSVFDVANFIAQGSGYTPEEACGVFDLYYQRPATREERALCLAATAFLGCYWFFWASCKAQVGDPVEEWLEAYADAVHRFGPAARDAIACCER